MEANEFLKLCRVSMCEPVKETDTDYLADNAPLGGGTNKKFVVEFGCKDFVINVTPGQKISEDDILGYMNNKPVRSKIKGVVLEVYDKYFIGEYTTNIEEYIKQFTEDGEASEDKIKAMFGL